MRAKPRAPPPRHICSSAEAWDGGPDTGRRQIVPLSFAEKLAGEIPAQLIAQPEHGRAAPARVLLAADAPGEVQGPGCGQDDTIAETLL